MPKNLPDKKSVSLFVFQIDEGVLKLIRCEARPSGFEVLAAESAVIPPGSDDKKQEALVGDLFKRLNYKNSPIIVCFPRILATLRYLKIPSLNLLEIERIVNFQASSYLPYPASELVSGFQVINTDSEGYSHINLSIVHTGEISKYLKLINALNPGKISIFLSSYGLVNLSNLSKKKVDSPVMVIDINASSIEIVIGQGKLVLFSRAFKINSTDSARLDNIFVEEVKKTQEAYSRERVAKAPQAIFLTGVRNEADRFREVIKKVSPDFAVEILELQEGVKWPADLLQKINNSGVSISGLLGLGLAGAPDSCNLIPQSLKDKLHQKEKFRKAMHLGAIAALALVFWVGGIIKNFDNKTNHLELLKSKLKKISEEARPLEEKERRLKLMLGISKKELTAFNFLHEVYRVVPEGVSLNSYNYEEPVQIILRGSASQLDSVFSLVRGLEGSVLFKNFQIKVNYATNRKTLNQERLDFEIACRKR